MVVSRLKHSIYSLSLHIYELSNSSMLCSIYFRKSLIELNKLIELSVIIIISWSPIVNRIILKRTISIIFKRYWLRITTKACRKVFGKTMEERAICSPINIEIPPRSMLEKALNPRQLRMKVKNRKQRKCRVCWLIKYSMSKSKPAIK